MNEIKDPQTIRMSRKFAEDLLENLYHLQAEWQHKEESRWRREAEEYGTLCDDIRELQALLGDDREMDLPWLDEEEVYDHYNIRMKRIELWAEESLIEKRRRASQIEESFTKSVANQGWHWRWDHFIRFWSCLMEWLLSWAGTENEHHWRCEMIEAAEIAFFVRLFLPHKCPDCGRRWRKCPNNGQDCVPF